jgi:adenylate cyclase
VSDVEVPLAEVEEDCFLGVLPSSIATVSAGGIPNVTSLSVIERVDGEHVALSRQFLNKTLANLAANPLAQSMLISPSTGRQYRLDLEHARTEIQGPLFDRMRTRLDAIASSGGMSNVFRLAAVDVFRVVACRLVPSDLEPTVANRRPVGLRSIEDFSRRIDAADDIDELLSTALNALAGLGYEHSLLLLLDGSGERLYTVASSGFGPTGAGAEVNVGEGLIGMVARRRVPVRLSNLVRDLGYVEAVGRSMGAGGDDEHTIQLPGLPGARSQLAVPVLARTELLGVLSVQSTTPGRFGNDDESLLALAARQIGASLALMRGSAAAIVSLPAEEPSLPASPPVVVRHYSADDSVFLDNEYLIKGVAGQILWRLLQMYTSDQRVDFSNREMRLDTNIELSEMRDNLDSRLVLLRRRLEDRCDFIRIQRTGRGRYRLALSRPIRLEVANTAN